MDPIGWAMIVVSGLPLVGLTIALLIWTLGRKPSKALLVAMRGVTVVSVISLFSPISHCLALIASAKASELFAFGDADFWPLFYACLLACYVAIFIVFPMRASASIAEQVGCAAVVAEIETEG